MSEFDFINLRNTILIICSLAGVLLLAFTCFKAYESSQGKKTILFRQLIIMLLISLVLIQLVDYMDMSSRTIFGSNSYTVAASDPWTVSENIQSIFQQISITAKDSKQISMIFAFLIQMIKLLGLILIFRSLLMGYSFADHSGNSHFTPGFIIGSFISGICLWNVGLLITLVSRTLGYPIEI